MLTEAENKIIEEVVSSIKYYKNTDIDIPFVIAPIYEALEKKMYEDMVSDISSHNHSIYYIEDDEYGDIMRNLLIQFETLPFEYRINCHCEDRYWGFCECTPDMEDYREDKQCCGHGCDWSAPMIDVEKIYHLNSHSWSGDEHSYWDFEDEYYKRDSALKEEKDLQYKEDRKKYLENEISKMTAELEKLY